MKGIAGEVSLRPVSSEDKEMLFEWRNKPELYSLGSSGKPITLEEHNFWFDEKVLKGGKTILFIINLDSKPVGQVRFDIDTAGIFKVSIYIAEKDYIHKGIGTAALKQGIELMIREGKVRKFIACVKTENEQSKSFFLKNGFYELTSHEDTPHGHISLIYDSERAARKAEEGNA